MQALSAVQQAAESAAGSLHTTADSVVLVADKSLPTAIGLAGMMKIWAPARLADSMPPLHA